jgi:hypothetical protein
VTHDLKLIVFIGEAESVMAFRAGFATKKQMRYSCRNVGIIATNRGAPMKRNMCVLGLVVAVLGFAACGSSGGSGSGGSSGSGGKSGNGGTSGGTGGSSGGGGSSGTLAALHDACMAFCTAQDDCNKESTAAHCVSYTCPPVGESTSKDDKPAACQAAYVAYWKCLIKQPAPSAAHPNICDQPGNCEAEGAATGTACN